MSAWNELLKRLSGTTKPDFDKLVDGWKTEAKTSWNEDFEPAFTRELPHAMGQQILELIKSLCHKAYLMGFIQGAAKEYIRTHFNQEEKH